MENNTAMYLTYRIDYVKHFLTGNLAGLDVNCHFTCPSDCVAGYKVKLTGNSPEYPSHDAVTGDAYWVKTVEVNAA
jgi:hypothetical protein